MEDARTTYDEQQTLEPQVEEFISYLSPLDYITSLVTNTLCSQVSSELNPIIKFDYECGCIESWFHSVISGSDPKVSSLSHFLQMQCIYFLRRSFDFKCHACYIIPIQD
jgi:hypothetical protein